MKLARSSPCSCKRKKAAARYYQQRDARNHERLVRHHQQALARLGYHVILTPPGDGSPPPARAA